MKFLGSRVLSNITCKIYNQHFVSVVVHSLSKSTCFQGLPILLVDLNPGGSSSLTGFKIPLGSYLFLVKESAIVTLALLADASIGVEWSMIVHSRKVGKMRTYRNP